MDVWNIHNAQAGDLVFALADPLGSGGSLDTFLEVIASDTTTFLESDSDSGSAATPLAAAVAEERQVFALDTRKMPEAIALNEALTIRPEETIPKLTNYLLIESLQKFHHYYGDEFRIECPTGSGKYLSIAEVAEELGRRLKKLFLRGPDGHRPIFGNSAKRHDPHFRDHVLFYEYFHGDNGHGLGAEHQTGWTGLVAKLIQPRRPD